MGANLRGLGVGLGIMLGFTGACGNNDDQSSQDESNVLTTVQGSGTVCAVETDSSIKDIYDSAQDPFRRKVLSTPGCREIMAKKDPYAITDFMKKSGCTPEGRFIVSEKGVAKVTTETAIDPRTIDQWRCGISPTGSGDSPLIQDRVWISGPGTAMHIISWDPASRSFNFYSADHPSASSQIFFHGNSHRQAISVSNSFRHPCTNCHVGGGLLLRELHFPWAFWHSDVSTLPGVMRKEWVRVKNSALPVKAVEEFEITTIASLIAANQTFIKGLAEGRQFGNPRPQDSKGPAKYKDILYPLFCERGIELVTSPDSSSRSVPWGLMINRLLVPRQGKVSLTRGLDSHRPQTTSRLDITGFGDSEDFAGLGSNRGVVASYPNIGDWNKAAASIFTLPTSGLGTRMLFPARHFSDDDLVSRLVASKIIPEEFAINILMVDIQNPIFSATRCGLLDKVSAQTTLPADPSQLLAQGTKVVADFDAAIGADPNKTNPGSGPGKYLAAKGTADKAAFVNTYAKGCETQLSDPIKAAKAVAIRWLGYKKPQPGIGSVYVGKDFNRGVEDFVEKAAIPSVKQGVKISGITQGCDVK